LRGEAKDDFLYLTKGVKHVVEFSAAAAFRHRFLLVEEANERVRPASITGYCLIFSNKTGKKKLNPPL
jgi:hypothetical protein